ncbi:transcription factor LHW-like isoform X3 [Curcuma longa]|uniref:transcription factor LHW-like isoform X3 n=1 Tax=Curcuma longa TaxID=136217 RepID=UPI003D9E88B3
MGLPLREALRQLCLDTEWAYAVFWKASVFQSRMHLIWEDGYYNQKSNISSFKISIFPPKQEALAIKSNCSELGSEADDAIQVLVEKIMASQVHFFGDGFVGQAASSGKYIWIRRDRFDSISKGLAELNCQIAAGMQTMLVVPVLPYGVIQLGSTQTVTENIGFIYHIKSLFTKLNYASNGLVSDSTQKSLAEECQIHTSSGSTFCSQTTNACLNMDDRLNATSDCCNPEFLKSVAPRSFSEYISLVSSQFNRMQPNVSKLVPTKQTIKMAYPMGKLILQSADDILRKPDIQPTQQVPPDDSDSRCQTERAILNSVLLSNTIKILEEELMFTSGVGPLEPTNNIANVGNVGSTSNSHHGTRCSSSSSQLSLNGTLPNLGSHAFRLRSTCTSEVSMDHPFSCNEVASTQSNAKAKENDDLVQSSHIYSSEPSVQVSCSDMLPSIFHGYAIGDLKHVGDQMCKMVDYEESGANIANANSMQCAQNMKESLRSRTSSLFASSNDMFHMLDVDQKTYWTNDSLADVVVHKNFTNSCNFTDLPSLPAESDACPIFDPVNEQISCAGLFSINNSDQLLDAVISKVNPGVNQGSDSNASVAKAEPSCISYGKSSCSSEKDGENNHESELHKSQFSSWVESCQSAKNDSDSNSKRVSEIGKFNRKRSRSGESPRPRPKDRQMIQDRIKELREIVPNGAKCSIDALLEKTIKHMLFLQSVTKHAEKLKVAGEPKISTDQGGLLLKDNFEGGATWAFEVGTRPITCPIVVEDLNAPRQLLVEMLCEERGSFLEIADFIRGLGLTILKGVMEAHKNKVWARFAVEANRDVTRMEIFLSLMQQLEPSAGSSSIGLPAAAGNINVPHAIFQQTSLPARVI